MKGLEPIVNLGLAGLGRIANAHLDASEHISNKAKFIAVQTSDRGKARAVQLAGKGVGVYDKLEQMLDDNRIAGVVVCYPSGERMDPIKKIAEAGKHLLVEKPLAIDFDEARRLVSICHSNNVVLMVAQSRRYSPVMKKAHDLLPEIGPILRIDINFLVNFSKAPTRWWTNPEMSGDLILDLQGSHSLDTIAWFMGRNVPQRLYSETNSFNKNFNGSDEANIDIKYRDGAMCSVHLSLNNKTPLHEIIIVGQKGTLKIDEHAGNVPFSFIYSLSLNGEILLVDEGVPSIYTHQLREFASAIKQKREPLSSGNDVLKSIELLHAAKFSAKNHYPYVF